MSHSSVAPFPWHALDSVTRDAVRALEGARRRLRAIGDVSKLEEAATGALGVPVSGLVRRTYYGPTPATDGGVSVLLAPADAAAVDQALLVRAETPLAVAIARRVTGRPIARVVDAAGAPAPEVVGAFAAAVAAVARRAHAQRALRVLAAGPSAALGRDFHARTGVACTLQATVVLGDDAFDVAISVPRASADGTAPDVFDARSLSQLGRAPIAMPVVIATLELSRAEASTLSVGDAVMLGLPEGASFAGRAVTLVPPRAEVGFVAHVGEGGGLVLSGEVVDAPWSATTLGDEMDSNEAGAQSSQKTMVDVLGDAPVVLRVEVGTCEMAARDWALVAKGDALSLGRRLGEPVVLRIAGAEVARGELVAIDGEIGVRIVEKLA